MLHPSPVLRSLSMHIFSNEQCSGKANRKCIMSEFFRFEVATNDGARAFSLLANTSQSFLEWHQQFRRTVGVGESICSMNDSKPSGFRSSSFLRAMRACVRPASIHLHFCRFELVVRTKKVAHFWILLRSRRCRNPIQRDVHRSIPFLPQSKKKTILTSIFASPSPSLSAAAAPVHIA